MLTRDAILKANDLPKEKVEVPEWGGFVFVRSMNGLERDIFEQSIYDSNGKNKKANLNNIRARLCALTIVDDKGERLFSNDDIDELGKKNAKALDRVFTKARNLNGLNSNDIEELAGN